EKIKRYDSLKKIIEEINRNLVLESIADNLIAIAFSLAAGNKGTCVLYLVDSQTQLNLTLFKAKKEDKKLIIKAKEGDIFDLWVLRHTSPLLIEDIKKDFRFDLEKLKAQDKRPVSSLISSPLISENRFLGILRLDHPDPYFYSQDDLRFLVTICDLGAVAIENGELFKKTQDLATHDELTTLYTKGYFLERLKEEHKRSVRQNRPLSLLMLDIDYFKNYNDRFGHGAGDNVLKALSQDIVEGLKDYSPIISRFGGEEFCVILSGIDKKRAGIIADGLREKIEKTKIILRRQETNITVSIGVAGFPDDSKDESELIMKADKAMYEAKQKGRNRVCGN
ncbi:MAG: sensor domain-containing diguanylate cyclase, partial [Candidatus Omnitrophica bacterium]|nr:sensor domain-containing diguanylate cyclase [Candidatus Omnitrophota bacterium]